MVVDFWRKFGRLARLLLKNLDMMTTTQTAAPRRPTTLNRWFSCAVLTERPDLQVSKVGSAAARMLSGGRVQIYSRGRAVTVSVADATGVIKAERTGAERTPLWLNADEIAQVEMGKVWISHS